MVGGECEFKACQEGCPNMAPGRGGRVGCGRQQVSGVKSLEAKAERSRPHPARAQMHFDSR